MSKSLKTDFLGCFSRNFNHLFKKFNQQPAFAELSPCPKFHSLPFRSDRPEVIDKQELGILSIRLARYKKNLAWAQPYSYSERGLYRYVPFHRLVLSNPINCRKYLHTTLVLGICIVYFVANVKHEQGTITISQTKITC